MDDVVGVPVSVLDLVPVVRGRTPRQALGETVELAVRAEQAAARYREAFQPSAHLERPHLAVAVAVVCADTDERARELALPNQVHMLRMVAGTAAEFPTMAEAAAYPITAEQRELLDARLGHHVVGSRRTVARRLRAVVDEAGADELVVMSMIADHADRVRSYELLAG